MAKWHYLFWFLQGIDVGLTEIIVQHGGTELNPLIAALVTHGGFISVLAWNLAMLIVWIAIWRMKPPKWLMAVALLFAGIVIAWNAGVIIRMVT